MKPSGIHALRSSSSSIRRTPRCPPRWSRRSVAGSKSRSFCFLVICRGIPLYVQKTASHLAWDARTYMATRNTRRPTKNIMRFEFSAPEESLHFLRDQWVGLPQLGQIFAEREIRRPHSGHVGEPERELPAPLPAATEVGRTGRPRRRCSASNAFSNGPAPRPLAEEPALVRPSKARGRFSSGSSSPVSLRPVPQDGQNSKSSCTCASHSPQK